MNKNMKLVFLDIDGTLNISGKEINNSVLDALTKVQGNGHKLFVSTGRLRSSISRTVREFPFDGGIFSAGRQIVIEEKVIYESYMDPTLLEKIRKVLSRNNAKQSIETRDGAYVSWHDDTWSISFDEWKHLTRIIGGPQIINLKDYANEFTYKIVFVVDSFFAAQQIADDITQISKVYNLPNLNTVIFGNMIKELPLVIGEISDSTINKGTALTNICNYYNMNISDTIAFGDSMNDAPIINMAGLGVAMANSEPELIEIADTVCGSVYEDGLVEAFKMLNLY